MALLFATPACAQFSGSATLLSDYRYRGVSLSDGRPVLQLSLAYDHSSGGYAGVMISNLRYVHESKTDTLLLPYAGYAWRLRPGLTAEAGVQYSRFIDVRQHDYAEVYAGLSGDHLGGRVYYAREYFGHGPAVYAELNGTRRLSERWRALGHVGVVRFNGIDRWDGAQDEYRGDLRIGIGLTLGAFDAQLSWGTAEGGDGGYLRYPYWDAEDKSAWVFGLSRHW